MLLEEIKNLEITEKILRKFGVLLSIFLAIFSVVSYWRAGQAYHFLLPIAIVMLGIVVFFPKLLKLIYWPWMAVALCIGWLMTRLILILLFYLMFLPIAVATKFFRMDLLDEKIEPQKKSYWQNRQNRAISKKDLEWQF